MILRILPRPPSCLPDVERGIIELPTLFLLPNGREGSSFTLVFFPDSMVPLGHREWATNPSQCLSFDAAYTNTIKGMGIRRNRELGLLPHVQIVRVFDPSKANAQSTILLFEMVKV